MTTNEKKYKDICKKYKNIIKTDCNSLEKKKHLNENYCEILENLYENCLVFHKNKEKIKK
jgi:hypothetical protein